LSQQYTSGSDQDTSELGTIYDYDVEAVILRKEIAPLTLYSRRVHDVLQREFGPSLDTTRTQTGAIWDIRSKTVPTRIEVYHSDETQTGLGELDNFDITQNVLTWHSDYRPAPNQIINWDYTLTQVHQTSGLVTSDFVTNDANFTYSIDFGRDKRNNFTSTVAYFNQSGDFQLERLRVDELLRLRHSDTFETFYEYTLDHQSFSQIDETENRGLVGFIHRLYASLVTTGRLGVSQLNQSEGGDTFHYYGNLNFDYTKRVPLGTLHAGLGLGYDHQEIDAHGVTNVIDSVGTFTDPQPIVIAAPNVVPGSLVVTDPSGLLLFTPGVDYTVTQLGTRTEIDRVIGGRISNGDTVLVDYQLEPEPASKSDTTYFSISARYDLQQTILRGIGIYGAYTRQDQNLNTSETSTLIEDSYTDVLYGADYHFRDFTIGAEHETHDSTLSPFDASRFVARWNRSLSNDTSFGAIANYTIIDYNDINNHADLLTLSGTINQRFSNELDGYITVLYRDEHDDLRGRTEGFEQQAELRWRHRQTTVYIRGRNSMLNTRDQDNIFQFLEVGIRRDF
jgi:hypothetical protein